MKPDAQKKSDTRKKPVSPEMKSSTRKKSVNSKTKKKPPKPPPARGFISVFIELENARAEARKVTGMTAEQVETILRPILIAATNGLVLDTEDLVVAFKLVRDLAPKTAIERMICGQILSTYFLANVNMHQGANESYMPTRTGMFRIAGKLSSLNTSLLELLHRIQGGEARKTVAFEYHHVNRKDDGAPGDRRKSQPGKRKQEKRPLNGNGAVNGRAMNGHAKNGHAKNGHAMNGHALNGHKPKHAQKVAGP